MMAPVHRIKSERTDFLSGKIVFDYPKAFWNLGIILLAICLAPLFYSTEALVLFITTTYLSLLIGHSVGMHRMMIHKTFIVPKWLERLLIYIGALVGMSGPYGIIKIHDVRDWAQRQNECHDFFSHRSNYLKDIFWQLSCKFEFDSPPKIRIENELWNDWFYQFLEKTWRLHQIALGIILFLIGGAEFVVWGILVRVSVSIVGHWTITYFCHNPGPGKWFVKGAAVQASNIPGLGLLTYGECWHNNHHAFPESARIGLDKGQTDPAYWFIAVLSKLGLVKNLGLPRPEANREDLKKRKD